MIDSDALQALQLKLYALTFTAFQSERSDATEEVEGEMVDEDDAT